MKRNLRRGQTVTEYLAIIGLILFACLAGLKLVGEKSEASFQKTGKAIETWFKVPSK